MCGHVRLELSMSPHKSQRQPPAYWNFKAVKQTMHVGYVNVSEPVLDMHRSVISEFIRINRAHITILLQQLNTNKEHTSQEAYDN